MPTITPNLWFDGNAKEAAEYYCSVFPNSKIIATSYYSDDMPMPKGTVLTVEFELDGSPFVGINAGPEFEFDEAVSFEIDCKDQAEIDYYWDTFVRDGGEEGQCGWCKDKFGLSWQVVHENWSELLRDGERGNRAMQAVMGMKKIDMAAIYAAAGDEPSALAKIGARVAKAVKSATKSSAKKAAPAKKAVATKVTAAKKTTGKKATTAKKTAVKKATTAKKTVKKKATTAKKTAVKKATAKKAR